MRTARKFDFVVVAMTATTILASAQAGAADPTPGPGAARFNPATGHFYEVVTGTWDEAEAKGVAKGGHLVTIDDAGEQAWLVSTFEMSNPETTPNGIQTVSAYWIGLNDRDVEGQYVWTSGKTLAETAFGSTFASPPWAPLEPTNATGAGDPENVVGMNFRICHFAPDWIACTDYPNSNDPGLWNDYGSNDGSNDFLAYGIIEYPPPQWTVDPRSTFLRTDSTDAAQAPLAIDLADMGVGPGDVIRIAQKGDFRYNAFDPAFQDDGTTLMAAFSGSASLLDTSNLHRIVDAIDAGDDITTDATGIEQLPTDVAEDFDIVPQTEITVPAGATHLFVGVHDIYYADNVDPDGDLGVDIVVVQKADPTKPVVRPLIDGTLGNDGWYVSDVHLSWDVSDPESEITSSSGCESVTITTDAAETGFTCTATSRGGTESVSVRIKRDATPPVAVATAAPRANAYGWRRTNVTVTFTGTDALSGGVTCDTQRVLSAEGRSQSASGRCYDAAGNMSALATATGINIDKTAPAIRFQADATIRLVWVFCSDALSGVDKCTATFDRARRTVTATGIDFAGNRRQASYRVPW